MSMEAHLSIAIIVIIVLIALFFITFVIGHKMPAPKNGPKEKDEEKTCAVCPMTHCERHKTMKKEEKSDGN